MFLCLLKVASVGISVVLCFTIDWKFNSLNLGQVREKIADKIVILGFINMFNKNSKNLKLIFALKQN